MKLETLVIEYTIVGKVGAKRKYFTEEDIVHILKEYILEGSDDELNVNESSFCIKEIRIS